MYYTYLLYLHLSKLYVMYYMYVCTSLAFDRFVEHKLLIEKEPGMIEWKARKSTQQKEAQEQDAAAKQTASMAEHMPKEEKDKDICLLEMGGEEASDPETMIGKHKYTHHLRWVTYLSWDFKK